MSNDEKAIDDGKIGTKSNVAARNIDMTEAVGVALKVNPTRYIRGRQNRSIDLLTKVKYDAIAK